LCKVAWYNRLYSSELSNDLFSIRKKSIDSQNKRDGRDRQVWYHGIWSCKVADKLGFEAKVIRVRN